MPTTKSNQISEASLQTFLKGLRDSRRIWYHIKYHYPSTNNPAATRRAFPEYTHRPVTNFPGPENTHFVCEQIMNDANEWKTESFQYFPSPELRHRIGTGGLNDFDEPFPACLAVDPLQICIASRKYTTSQKYSEDLQALILKLLIQADIQPLPQPELRPRDGGDAMITDSSPNVASTDCVNDTWKILLNLADDAEKQGIAGEVDYQDTTSTIDGNLSAEEEEEEEEDIDKDSDGTIMDQTEGQGDDEAFLMAE
ncbi:hypothetical protein N0V93_006251 [Gnomoniopsis smithogilvyi]|uniref:Uncharacterized protein n=1 Tax=Gnomoniopsis smithogilvyi TaxID=1191159 RepID=A0A9W9CVF0_9PEZI|nr:hypothetical protein N0V93_006251 [Gnomoniopsis smithogilvyi]